MAELDLAAIRAHAGHASPGDLEDHVLALCAELERSRDLVCQQAADLLTAERREHSVLDALEDARVMGSSYAYLSAYIREVFRG